MFRLIEPSSGQNHRIGTVHSVSANFAQFLIFNIDYQNVMSLTR